MTDKDTRPEQIDWEKLRNTLANASVAPTEDAKFVQKILRERAAKLAARREPIGEDVLLSVLEFSLGNERFAVELIDLYELLKFRGCTPLPGGPEELLGLMGHQGEIVPVIHLLRFLGLPESDLSTPSDGYVLLVRAHHGGGLGLWVKDIERTGRVAFRETSPRPYVRGLGPDSLSLLSIETISTRYR
jgi:purine-binding chemotaxis protein CheW